MLLIHKNNSIKKLAVLEIDNFRINNTGELAEGLYWSHNEQSPEKIRKQSGARGRVML